MNIAITVLHPAVILSREINVTAVHDFMKICTAWHLWQGNTRQKLSLSFHDFVKLKRMCDWICPVFCPYSKMHSPDWKLDLMTGCLEEGFQK